jgi:serine/threonine-protein kinase
MDLAAPISLAGGRYRLDRVLGEGGMATVYRAHDTRLKVERAVKVLNASLASSAKLRLRFEEEAQTMARLHHPNIVTVHDVGTDGEQAFIVMELVGGGSLMDRVQRDGPLDAMAAIDVARKILAALGHAHRDGVVHRDVKPHNVLLAANGIPKVTDFGIARVQQREQALTMTGARMGTIEYMAPEIMADATSASPQSDLYAVAGTILACLTGRNPPALYADNLHSKIMGRFPAPLARVIVQAGRYEAGDRFASAEAMSDALGAAGEEISGRMDLSRATTFPARSGRDTGGYPISTGDGVVAMTPAPSAPGTSSSGPTLEPEVASAVRTAVPPSSTYWGDAPGTSSGTFTVGDDEPTADGATQPRRGLLLLAGAVVGLALVGVVAWQVGGAGGHASPAPRVADSTSVPAAIAPAAGAPTDPALPEVSAPSTPPPADTSLPSARPGAPPTASPARVPGAARSQPANASLARAATPAAPPGAEDGSAASAPVATVALSPVPAATPPAAAPAPAPGLLRANSVPAGSVRVDGGAALDLPLLDLELPAGEHVLSFADGEGRAGTLRVTVPAGASVAACWDFDEGRKCSR